MASHKALTLVLILAVLFGSTAAIEPVEDEFIGHFVHSPVDPVTTKHLRESVDVSNVSLDAVVEPIEPTESSVCTCEQVVGKDQAAKRAKDQGAVENLVIEKKSGKNYDVITITIPNEKKSSKPKPEDKLAEEALKILYNVEPENANDEPQPDPLIKEEAKDEEPVEEPKVEEPKKESKTKDKSSKKNEKKRAKRSAHKSSKGSNKGKKGNKKGHKGKK